MEPNVDEPTPDEERWLPIVGWEDCYEVSDLGRVRSVDRLILYKDGRVSHRKSRFMKRKPEVQGGHMAVHLSRYGKRYFVRVHTLVLETFVGPKPSGTECCHNNGNPADNRITNLRWDTRSKNRLDMVRHGTHPQTLRECCPLQHKLIPPNLRPADLAAGRRACLACARARSYAWMTHYRTGRIVEFAATANKYYVKLMGDHEDSATAPAGISNCDK